MLELRNLRLAFEQKEDPNFELIKNNVAILSDYVIMRFKSPGKIYYEDGTEENFYPYDCVVFSPRVPRHIKSIDCLFVHDWISFIPMSEFKFPNITFNRLFRCPQEIIDDDLIKSACLQFSYHTPSSLENTRLIINVILNVINETSVHEITQSNYNKKLQRLFLNIRQDIYSMNFDSANIYDLASGYGLSRTHFTCLYKQFFNVSPARDVIKAKITYAKFLLKTTDYTLREIAFKCKFSNEFTFLRCFKRETTLTPTEFRSQSDR